MATTNFNIRLDDGLKAKAFPVFERYGLTAAQAIKLFLNQVAETHTIPLSFDYANHVPNRITIEALEAVKLGEVTTYDTPEEAMQAMLSIANGEE